MKKIKEHSDQSLKEEKAKRSIEMLIASGAKLGNKKGAILIPLTNSQREHLQPSTQKLKSSS